MTCRTSPGRFLILLVSQYYSSSSIPNLSNFLPSMKSCFTTTIALVASAAAYPQAILNLDQTLYSPLVQQVSAAAEGLVTSGSSQSTTTPFSATAQKISVSGIHAWRAPGPGDARGMYGCFFLLMLPQMSIDGSFGSDDSLYRTLPWT